MKTTENAGDRYEKMLRVRTTMKEKKPSARSGRITTKTFCPVRKNRNTGGDDFGSMDFLAKCCPFPHLLWIYFRISCSSSLNLHEFLKFFDFQTFKHLRRNEFFPNSPEFVRKWPGASRPENSQFTIRRLSGLSRPRYALALRESLLLLIFRSCSWGNLAVWAN